MSDSLFCKTESKGIKNAQYDKTCLLTIYIYWYVVCPAGGILERWSRESSRVGKMAKTQEHCYHFTNGWYVLLLVFNFWRSTNQLNSPQSISKLAICSRNQADCQISPDKRKCSNWRPDWVRGHAGNRASHIGTTFWDIWPKGTLSYLL